MSFSYSSGVDASRSTFNDVAGNQIYNLYFTAAPPSGHIHHVTPLSAPPTGPANTLVDSKGRVAAVLDDAVKVRGQSLNWRQSIVDLLKALGLNSSYAARQRLAVHWGYEGDITPAASYAMNMWLHGRIMRKLEDGSGSEDLVSGIAGATQ